MEANDNVDVIRARHEAKDHPGIEDAGLYASGPSRHEKVRVVEEKVGDLQGIGAAHLRPALVNWPDIYEVT
jgi:hypothetical protein